MTGTPVRYNLVIVQGDSFSLPVQHVDMDGAPMDLSGRSWIAQWRPSYDSPSKVDFTVDLDNLDNGIVTLRLDESLTASLVNGVWDLVETRGADTSRLLYGEVVITRTVTR